MNIITGNILAGNNIIKFNGYQSLLQPQSRFVAHQIRLCRSWVWHTKKNWYSGFLSQAVLIVFLMIILHINASQLFSLKNKSISKLIKLLKQSSNPLQTLHKEIQRSKSIWNWKIVLNALNNDLLPSKQILKGRLIRT